MIKLFSVVEKNYNRIEGVISAPSSSMALRDHLPYFRKVHPYFLDDFEFHEIGFFNSDNHLITTEERVVDWSECSNPELVSRPLTEDEKKDLNSISNQNSQTPLTQNL